ncbi:hypothetical protein M569_16523 [Genlisea aurea]|uniref:DM2 domain-containing protein n=1 Tax=Genlisea aurea TaxID=192259 RepID=S8BUN4_9LAMI|nr:hypothetical protein M569_16523 [Genlisea aurea]
MVVVTEHQIAEALDSLLRETRAFTSFDTVVHLLELKLGVDLSTKLEFIHARLQHYFHLQPRVVPQHHQQDRFMAYQVPPSSQHAVQSFAAGVHSRPNLIHHQSSWPAAPPPMMAAKKPVQIPAKESAPPAKKRRVGTGGLSKPCGVSPELQTIVGQSTLTRTEIVKQLWAYIRKHKLQDPNNKRKIICNDELRLVFDTDCTDMFKMNKLLAKHILPLGSSTEENSKKLKSEEALEESEDKSEDHLVVTVGISEALAGFFGCEDREMPQSEVMRRMWDYIKVNQLEDPSNPTSISCDVKLEGLLGCKTVSPTDIPEMLSSRHHVGKK